MTSVLHTKKTMGDLELSFKPKLNPNAKIRF